MQGATEEFRARLKELSDPELQAELGRHEAEYARAMRATSQCGGYSHDADAYWEEAAEAEVRQDLCLAEQERRDNHWGQWDGHGARWDDPNVYPQG